MPDRHRHRPSPAAARLPRPTVTVIALILIVTSACAPPAAAPPQTGSAAPDNDSTSAVERPALPSPFNDRTCTWTSDPAATRTSTPQRTCSLQLAAATPHTTQFRFHDGHGPIELRFEADSVTILDGIGEASGAIQGVRPSDLCWHAVAGYTRTPDSGNPLALQAMSFQLTWCSDTADLTLIRTATTSVGTRRQTVHVAD